MVEWIFNEQQFFLIFMFTVFAYFLYLAEEKMDAIYFLISGVLALPMGVYWIWVAGAIFHYFFGVMMILISMYLFYLFLATSFKIRKKEKED